jgi:DNA repair exonuclease SbcCD nuclease subunit
VKKELTLLHTADVHLGDDLDPVRRMQGFRRTLQLAQTLRVDLVVIAGDLFDNARVSTAVVEETLSQLARAAQRVVILPGNHDTVASGLTYGYLDLTQAGDHVRVLDQAEGHQLVFDDLGLTVWGRGMEEHSPDNRPLEGHPEPLGDGWHVSVAHGHYVPEGETSTRSSPIRAEDIAALACHYLALGHWHRYLDVTTRGVRAFYPGAPAERGSDYASVNLVSLDPRSGVHVDRIPTGAER